jgi:hypothetical protein
MRPVRLGQGSVGILERLTWIILTGFMIPVAVTNISSPRLLWANLRLLLGAIMGIIGVTGTCPMNSMFEINT